MGKGKSGSKAAGLPALDQSPSHLLHRALQLAQDIYADGLATDGPTQRQFALLVAVSANEGVTQTDLVRLTGIDRSTLADMAARMISKGLLQRQRSATDGRANAVHLTDAGRAMLADAQPRMAKTDARLLKQLSSSKRETLIDLLQTLVGDKGKKPKAEKIKKSKKKAD